MELQNFSPVIVPAASVFATGADPAQMDTLPGTRRGFLDNVFAIEANGFGQGTASSRANQHDTPSCAPHGHLNCCHYGTT
jgi:hypothetical protein